MYILSLRHHVSECGAWKAVFDERLADRHARGVIGHRLTRACNDPNEVEVVMHFATDAMIAPCTAHIPVSRPRRTAVKGLRRGTQI